MKLGRFLNVSVELITILEEHPEIFTTIINTTVEEHYQELLALIDLLSSVEVTTPTREFGQMYHNGSGKIMVVILDAYMRSYAEAADDSLVGNSSFIAYIGPTQETCDIKAGEQALSVCLRKFGTGLTKEAALEGTLTFIVPNGWYYWVDIGYSGDGQEPIQHAWLECFLF